ELRRGLRKFNGRLRRRILRAVNDVAPMNQVRERLGIEAELFLGDRRNQLGARFVVRLIKHARAGPFAELFRVGGRQKRALVMVEPPRQFRRIGKFEIYNYIFVAVEQPRFPGLRCAVRHSREAEFCVLVKTFAVKPVKESGGSSAIKAAIVKAEPDLGHRLAYSLLRLRTIRIQARRSQPTCTWAAGLSRRKG